MCVCVCVCVCVCACVRACMHACLSYVCMWIPSFFPLFMPPLKALLASCLVRVYWWSWFDFHFQYSCPDLMAVRALRGHQLPVTCAVISPDSKTAFSASKDGSIIKCECSWNLHAVESCFFCSYSCSLMLQNPPFFPVFVYLFVYMVCWFVYQGAWKATRSYTWSLEAERERRRLTLVTQPVSCA